MSKTRASRGHVNKDDGHGSKKEYFYSVENDAYHEDFLRQNLNSRGQEHLSKNKAHGKERPKSPAPPEGSRSNHKDKQKIEDNAPRRSPKKQVPELPLASLEGRRGISRPHNAHKHSEQEQEAFVVHNHPKVTQHHTRQEARFIADSFRGDLLAQNDSRRGEARRQYSVETLNPPEQQIGKPQLTLEHEELMNHYQELLELTIPQTLRPFLKSPTVFVDIVTTIFSAVNEFLNDKISSTLADLARVLGIQTTDQTLLDILLKYSNGLNHLQPKEEDHILADVFRRVHSGIADGSKIHD